MSGSATISSKNASLKKGYRTHNGIHQKILKGWISKGGTWQTIFTSAAAFSYEPADGMILNGSLEDKWELAFTKSGTLTVESINADTVQGFAVGGGQNGGDLIVKNPAYQVTVTGCGKGGDGGKLYNGNLALSEGTYDVHIGAAGEDSYISHNGVPFFTSGDGAVIAAGGASADMVGRHEDEKIPAGNGVDGQLAFNGEDCLAFPGRLFGASAAGGGARYFKEGGYYGSVGKGIPGNTGAGKAGDNIGSFDFKVGEKGADNTGAGGGPKLGAGGTGILIIKN